MVNKDITHAKIAGTDREPPHGARKKKDDEFDNLYIDAQKFTAHDGLGVDSRRNREEVVPD
jgi:hypothetical protein